MNDDLLIIRAPILNFFVLRESDELYLIDTGFLNGVSQLQRALKRRGWQHLQLAGILLTHGHLDHVLNAEKMARSYGAWIAAPRLDAAHYQGKQTYTGLARVTGLLESVGRSLFRFQTFTPDRWIDDGTEFPIWQGLRAVALPGHTSGHVGFYCPSRRVLFSGDLFNSHYGFGYRSLNIFNSFPKQIPSSIAAAAKLDLAEVYPNHCDRSTPAVHLARLQRLNARLNRPPKR